MSYSYDSVNRPTKSYYTSNTQETYTYDSLGRLSSSSLKLTSGTLSKSYVFHSSANYSGKTTNQIKTENIGDRGYQYTYDRVGNITAIKEKTTAAGNFNDKVSYTYDNLNQLTRENNKDLNKTITYSYDGNGNITSVKEYAYTTGTLPQTPTKTITYTYDSVWKDKLVNYNGQAITYDSIGNPLTYRDGMTFSWFGRQMESATVNGTAISYKYNADGLRTEKAVGSTVHKYEYTGDKLFYEKRGNLEFYYRYDVFGNLASITRVNADGTSFSLYTVCNSQGDVEELRRSTGELFARYVYDSWGNVLHIYDVSGAEITSTANLAVQNPFRYRGYYYDNETGLYYLQSRYYDPVTHRFLNADAYVSTSILGCNIFAYCMNNPVNMIDVSGHWPEFVTGLINIVGGGLQAAAGVMLGVAVGWTGFGAVAAGVLMVNGSATLAQGVGQVVNDIANADVMRDDNIVKTAVTDIGAMLGGEPGANLASSMYDLTVLSATVYSGFASYTPCACFVAGTVILTYSGNKSIEEIQVGDYVWASNPDTGETDLKKVVQTFINDSYELVHIFADNEEIIATSEHPFYVPNQGWVIAKNLRAGDILVTVNGKYVIVEKIQHEILENPVKVYNFEVEDFHTYFVSDCAILVHNTCKPSSPVKVSKNALKQIDAHAFKLEFTNNIVRWDIFKDTAHNSVLWLGNKTQTVWIETGMYLEELIELFPKR